MRGAPGLCLNMLAGGVVFGLKTAFWEAKYQWRERGCGIVVCFSAPDSCLVSWSPQEIVANQVHREHPDPSRIQ